MTMSWADNETDELSFSIKPVRPFQRDELYETPIGVQFKVVIVLFC